MRGERPVLLLPTKSRKAKPKRTRIEKESWEGVDRDLFESLRELRREVAEERGVPAYVVFTDATLRDMARRRPRNPQEMLAVHGVGERKLRDHGERFLARIEQRAADPAGDGEDRLETEEDEETPLLAAVRKHTTKLRRRGRELYAERATVEEVAARLDCSRRAAVDHLVEYVTAERPHDLTPWVEDEARDEILEAARALKRPTAMRVHEALGGRHSHDAVRVVLAALAGED
jgi:ATP-dependent DNA helicase RecQ